MNEHGTGRSAEEAPRQGVAVMTTTVGTFPHFHYQGVIAPPRAGWSYVDLVDELRRSALLHFEEEQQAQPSGRLCCSTDES